MFGSGLLGPHEDKRRIVVEVFRGTVQFGGDVAAPVFSEVVQQTLRIQGLEPDMAVKPQIVARSVEESF